MQNNIFALGFFDGVHLGHQALLNECVRLAGECGCTAGAVTFETHPDALVCGASPALINTPADRDALLHTFVPRIVRLPFDERMRRTPWQEFLDMLCREYGAAGFVCGDDFRFGDKGIGNAERLADYCAEHRLPFAAVPEQTVDGERVSSTRIRQLLETGEIRRANAFLGHPHILSGEVVHGKQLGRTLGIPTANLSFPQELAVPKFGVYACLADIDGKKYPAVTNIGVRPTVSGHGITVEPWLLDFSGDLYGKPLRLEFYDFVRPEVKFASLDELKAEIERNAVQVRKTLHESFTCHP